ncbi:MAG TPA: NAD(P)H-hydrate dehydratase [Candidatus Bathyarchaeia archaeon]|nr:NAD(P)H-hydrate dehydratase [Candidatus Bathyarchaeia archaeon]
MRLEDFYPKRDRESRKGDFGRIIVAGGSERYAGCLAFNGLAALRAGADLSIIVAPERAANIAAGYSPDLITVPCTTRYPEPDKVAEVLDKADSLVVGGGVEKTRKAHAALVSIIRNCTKPIVADAEALHAIAEKPAVVKGKKIVLNPNGGEYRTLTGQAWPWTESARRRAVKSLARRYDCTVSVKGGLDFISDGDRVHVDRAGSPYMTKGGIGDLLAGVLAAHLARGRSPFDAARAAALVVGLSGEKAARIFGEGLTASDVLATIPSILPNRNGH